MEIQMAYQQLLTELKQLHSPGEAASIARIVFEDAFGIQNFSRKDLLDEEQQQTLQHIRNRLQNGEPVQYALGQAAFYGLILKVSPAVLIPRQETEELVQWILDEHSSSLPFRILDIGCGSACIPLALKSRWPKAELNAVDVSSAALSIGQENAQQLGLKVDFKQLNVLEEKEWEQLGIFDLIVSNPPYIPTAEKALMPQQVLDHEPSLALFVEDHEPLIFYQKITELARHHLAPEGWLYFEANEFNAQQVVQLLQEKGFEAIELRKDMQGKDRMIRAKRS